MDVLGMLQQYLRPAPANPLLQQVGGGTRGTRGVMSDADAWLNRNAPFPTQAKPWSPPMTWTENYPVLDPADPNNYGPGSPFGRNPPSPDILKQLNEWWSAQQGGSPSPLNSMMRREPLAMY